jgi:hypothetical protein
VPVERSVRGGCGPGDRGVHRSDGSSRLVDGGANARGRPDLRGFVPDHIVLRRRRSEGGRDHVDGPVGWSRDVDTDAGSRGHGPGGGVMSDGDVLRRRGRNCRVDIERSCRAKSHLDGDQPGRDLIRRDLLPNRQSVRRHRFRR